MQSKRLTCCTFSLTLEKELVVGSCLLEASSWVAHPLQCSGCGPGPAGTGQPQLSLDWLESELALHVFTDEH